MLRIEIFTSYCKYNELHTKTHSCRCINKYWNTYESRQIFHDAAANVAAVAPDPYVQLLPGGRKQQQMWNIFHFNTNKIAFLNTWENGEGKKEFSLIN